MLKIRVKSKNEITRRRKKSENASTQRTKGNGERGQRIRRKQSLKCAETHSRSEGKSSAIISKVKLSVFLLLLLLLLQPSAIIFFSPLSLSLSLTFYLSPSLSQRKYLFPFILYFDVRVFCFSRRLLFFTLHLLLVVSQFHITVARMEFPVCRVTV